MSNIPQARRELLAINGKSAGTIRSIVRRLMWRPTPRRRKSRRSK